MLTCHQGETCLGAEHVETLAAKAALAGAILRSLGPEANLADVKTARAEAEELHLKVRTFDPWVR